MGKEPAIELVGPRSGTFVPPDMPLPEELDGMCHGSSNTVAVWSATTQQMLRRSKVVDIVGVGDLSMATRRVQLHILKELVAERIIFSNPKSIIKWRTVLFFPLLF